MKRRRRKQLGQIVNGTEYHDETDPRVVKILEDARDGAHYYWDKNNVNRGERICIRYGDQDTGLDWGDPAMCGTVTRSRGTPGRDYTNKVPVLLPNVRSTGGYAILDHKIVRITRGAKPKDGRTYVLFEHPKYHYPEGERAAQAEAIARDAEIEARHAARSGDTRRAEELRKKAREIRRGRFAP